VNSGNSNHSPQGLGSAWVGSNPNLADEYDDYIPDIPHLIDAHCTADQLEQYLRNIEERWELAPDPSASRIAKKIFEAFQDRG
jgi:hypothetical protein